VKTKWIAGVMVMVAIVLLAGMLALPAAPAAAQAPLSNQLTVSVYAATSISGTTVNTAAPNIDAEARDVSLTTSWGSVDVFIVADVASSATLTATVQVSPDGVNWADADYEYWTGSAIGTKTHQRVMTADGTEIITLPLAGDRWRVQLTTTAPVTTTVKATLHR
jgi:hypothetical protein